jgi:hypothetical protein
MSIATAELCDRCTATAKFTVLITSTGGTLTFCGHHFTKNETQLKQIGEVFEYGAEPAGSLESRCHS